jgi:ubiquinone/menaquinone biosynthesis C-methylase UbiE
VTNSFSSPLSASPASSASSAALDSASSAARAGVISYYDDCRNDYRILWRTDETGSIHFGYFDAPGEVSPFPRRAAGWVRTPAEAVWGLGAALSAAALALTGTAWGRERAVRCLRVAARGRAARHDHAQARMTEVCAEMAALAPGERVLDAGCGVGGTGLWLASRHGVTVHGVNVQPAHLREARARASAQADGRRLTFSAQDFTAMALADAAFDVVWALESLCHAADKAGFVREACRVLRPGGRLMVADFFAARDGLPRSTAARMQSWTSGWALPHLATVSGFRTSLAEHGFHDIAYRDIGTNVLPSSRRLYKASLIALPIHEVLQRLGARSAVQGRNVRAARDQYGTLCEGAWTYGIFVALK